MLHAKIAVIDGEWSKMVGSFNLDSSLQNHELLRSLSACFRPANGRHVRRRFSPITPARKRELATSAKIIFEHVCHLPAEGTADKDRGDLMILQRRGSRLNDPTVDHSPSITAILACNIGPVHSNK